MKIPQEILADFSKRKALEKPKFTVRGLTDMNGNIGETFILAANNFLLCYSGKFSEEYKCFEYNFTEIHNVRLEEERPFAYLAFEHKRQPTRLKFAVFDLKILEKIKGCWEHVYKEKRAEQPSTPITIEGVGEENVSTQNASFSGLTPMLGLCACLQALIHIDSEVVEEERKKLTLVVDNHQLLKEGRDCWQKVGTNQLISDLRSLLSPAQKRCLLANLLEVAMVDGLLHEREKVFIEKLRTALDVDVSEFNTIFDVLLTKNNLTIF